MNININNLTDAQREDLKSQIENYENCNKSSIQERSIEKRFLEIIDGIEVVSRVNIYIPNSVFFRKGGEFLFERNIERNLFWVNDSIRNIFMKEYKIDAREASKFLRRMIEKHLKYENVRISSTVYIPIVK